MSEQIESGVAAVERRAGNRRIGICLALFAVLVFGSFIVRQWLGNH
jgi:hypothetical protein